MQRVLSQFDLQFGQPCVEGCSRKDSLIFKTVNDSMNTIFYTLFARINDETQLQTRQAQISEQLRLENRIVR